MKGEDRTGTSFLLEVTWVNHLKVRTTNFVRKFVLDSG